LISDPDGIFGEVLLLDKLLGTTVHVVEQATIGTHRGGRHHGDRIEG
jgi:hypothetical protein